MSEEYACYVLASWATHISRTVIQICNDNRSKVSSSARRRIAGEVATRLAVIGPALESLQPYGVEPSIEGLSRDIVSSLAQIFVKPQCQPEGQRPCSSLQQFHVIFSRQLTAELKHTHSSLMKRWLCRDEYRNLVDGLNAKCLELYGKLSQNDIDDTSDLPDNARDIDSHIPVIEFSNGLFEKIQDFAQCNPGMHSDKTDNVEGQTIWHPARLCLSEEGQNAGSVTFFLSARNMMYWQGFRLNILPDDHASLAPSPFQWERFCEHQEVELYKYVSLSYGPFRDKFQFHDFEVPNDQDQLPGLGCGETLSTVIRDYSLTLKNKIVLAYFIARAYWQFYDSELMRTKWTSDSIWFLPRWTPPTEYESSPGEILLRPYLAFPFGLPKNPLEDVVHNDMLNHKYPRIFRIGILLLEIGLGKPFPSPKKPLDPVSRTNLDHRIALSELAKLRGEPWPGFSQYKSYFEAAVSHCIQSQNLIKQPSELCSGASDTSKSILARRQAFYNNVVRPLAWLARTGFKHSSHEVELIRRKDDFLPCAKTLSFPPVPQATFHGGNEAAPKRWLKALNVLSAEIARERSQRKITAPIRVAILDTGLNLELPEFAEHVSWTEKVKHNVRDFVDQSGGKDTFGHGSFMTRLVMQCAPFAEIYVARVARSSKDLKLNQDKVKKAIMWAGGDCEADIISMSFGFPADDQGIIDAIAQVKSQRNDKVIFLSSCGNSPTEDENFPARNPSVISIYATDYHGVFLSTNARPQYDGPVVLGTYGSNIPDDFCVELRKQYPNICTSGSSIATAVAAGIGATMLAFASILLDGAAGHVEKNAERKLRLLWRSDGMETLFKRMVRYRSGRKWFVDPISFWKDNAEGGSHSQRFRAFVDCLHEVDRRMKNAQNL